MGDGALSYDMSEDDFVEGIEGDPDPGVTEHALECLEGLQVALLLADEGPHLVELALGDDDVVEEGTTEPGRMLGGTGEGRRGGSSCARRRCGRRR